MKARIKFRKYGVMKYIGHLDVMRFFQKAIRRAGIPIAYTEGYSPHMIMSFAQPLGVGTTSDGEYFDIELKESISSSRAVEQLNHTMVEGIEVISFLEIPEDKKSSGMTIVAAADYLVYPKEGSVPEAWKEQVEAFRSQKSIVVWKKTKRSEREVDIRPMIYDFQFTDQGIEMQLAAGSEENLKPDLVMQAFLALSGTEQNQFPLQYHRVEVYARDDRGALCSLESLGTEIL